MIKSEVEINFQINRFCIENNVEDFDLDTEVEIALR